MLLPGLLTTVGVILLLLSDWWGLRRLRAASKMVAAGGFVWGAAAVTGSAPEGGEVWMLAGFGLSFLGDLCLLSRAHRVFLVGIASFGLAHLAYTWAFLGWGGDGWILGAALAGAALMGAGAWRWLAPHVSGAMRIGVALYIVAIGVMLASAMAATLHEASAWIALGATSFAVSDLSVAHDRFLQRERRNLMWGPPLYFGAQWMFILGL